MDVGWRGCLTDIIHWFTIWPCSPFQRLFRFLFLELPFHSSFSLMIIRSFLTSNIITPPLTA